MIIFQNTFQPYSSSRSSYINFALDFSNLFLRCKCKLYLKILSQYLMIARLFFIYSGAVLFTEKYRKTSENTEKLLKNTENHRKIPKKEQQIPKYILNTD